MSQPHSRSPSRSPSPVSDHDNRTPNKAAFSRSPSVASQHDDGGAPNETTQLPRKQPRRRLLGHPRTSSSEVSDQDDRRQGMPILDEMKDTDRALTKTAGGPVNKKDETTGEVVVVGGGENEEGDNEHPVKLKVDLDLDVDIEVEARVRGDLTLSLLR